MLKKENTSPDCKAHKWNDKVVCAGGLGKKGKIVEYFNPSRFQWFQLPNTNIARISPAITEMDGRIVIAGGGIGDKRREKKKIFSVTKT